MNAAKREAALALDAKLEHVHGLSARIDDATTLAEDTHTEIHQFILKLIQKLETERTRLDTEWNSPKLRLPFKTFADNWIENLETLVTAIESGTPISAENIRALSARRVGALRNVTEKSVVAEQLLYAPNFNEALQHAINYTGAISILGAEGDEEIIYAFLDKLYSEDNGVPENYRDIAFTQIISGAIKGEFKGQHRALIEKLINDERFVPRNEYFISDLIKTAIVFQQFKLLPFLLHHPKLRLGGEFQRDILDSLHPAVVPQIVRNTFQGGGTRRHRRRYQRKSHKRILNA
jgi:hypothetical protein